MAMSDRQWPNRGAVYASECSQCEHRVAIKLPVSEGQKPGVWGWCVECGHTNWLEKQS